MGGYDRNDPLRPIGPGHHILTVEQAEQQAREMLNRVDAPPHTGIVLSHPEPLGYMVLLHGDPDNPEDDTWHGDWSMEVYHDRARALDELRAARRTFGHHEARLAVLYPLEG